MNPNAMVIVALIVVPALVLAAWAWFAMARVEEELRSFNGFEGMHFEIGPQAPDHSEGAT